MDQTKQGLAGLAPRRKAAGYTQAGLAVALDVSRSLLAAWEVGQLWPSAQRLPKMARLLGCSIEELYEPPAGDKRAAEGVGPYNAPGTRAAEGVGPYNAPGTRAAEGVGPYESILTEEGGENHAGGLPEHLPQRQADCRSDAGALG